MSLSLCRTPNFIALIWRGDQQGLVLVCEVEASITWVCMYLVWWRADRPHAVRKFRFVFINCFLNTIPVNTKLHLMLSGMFESVSHVAKIMLRHAGFRCCCWHNAESQRVLLTRVAGEWSAGGDQWRQHSRDDTQPGRGADPKGRSMDTPCTEERQRICTGLWWGETGVGIEGSNNLAYDQSNVRKMANVFCKCSASLW